jgi:hypothetical protein
VGISTAAGGFVILAIAYSRLYLNADGTGTVESLLTLVGRPMTSQAVAVLKDDECRRPGGCHF